VTANNRIVASRACAFVQEDLMFHTPPRGRTSIASLHCRFQDLGVKIERDINISKLESGSAAAPSFASPACRFRAGSEGEVEVEVAAAIEGRRGTVVAVAAGFARGGRNGFLTAPAACWTVARCASCLVRAWILVFATQGAWTLSRMKSRSWMWTWRWRRSAGRAVISMSSALRLVALLRLTIPLQLVVGFVAGAAPVPQESGAQLVVVELRERVSVRAVRAASKVSGCGASVVRRGIAHQNLEWQERALLQ
jgi:hypothetical protein